MENEGIKIVTRDKEKVEVILRKVDKVNELPVKPPVQINLEGIITAPYEFLLKRHDQIDQVNEKHCLVIVDREKLSISLITHDDDPYMLGKVVGKLEVHPKFKEFGVNTGTEWSPVKLGMFFKMNRAYFKSKEENMKLVTELMNFKATVDKKIEQSVKEKGDRTDNFSQVVNSNLPEKFNISIPLMKGYPAEDIEVETFAQIDGREISFILISPGAQETMDLVTDGAIDEQIKKISSLAPDIAIIEQ